MTNRDIPNELSKAVLAVARQIIPQEFTSNDPLEGNAIVPNVISLVALARALKRNDIQSAIIFFNSVPAPVRDIIPKDVIDHLNKGGGVLPVLQPIELKPFMFSFQKPQPTPPVEAPNLFVNRPSTLPINTPGIVMGHATGLSPRYPPKKPIPGLGLPST